MAKGYGAVRSLRARNVGTIKAKPFRRGPAQGGEDLTEALISRQIPLVVPIAVGPSAHGSANLAGPMQLWSDAAH